MAYESFTTTNSITNYTFKGKGKDSKSARFEYCTIGDESTEFNITAG